MASTLLFIIDKKENDAAPGDAFFYKNDKFVIFCLTFYLESSIIYYG